MTGTESLKGVATMFSTSSLRMGMIVTAAMLLNAPAGFAADIGQTVEPPVDDRCMEGTELTVSGQVNRAFLYADNGLVDDTYFVDNDNSSTRVRFTAEGHLNCMNRIGAQIEVQFESNSTAAIRFDQDSSAGPNNFTERKLEVWWENDYLGKIWLGQGDTASNGTSEVDLSGTSVVSYAGIADMAGGLEFENGLRISTVFSQFDGLSRRDRIRYDTPTFAGFKLSTSFTDEDFWDVALRFAGEFGGTKVVAAASYVEPDTAAFDYQISGSASVLLANGFNATIAAGMQEKDTVNRDGTTTDPVFYYGKLGYKANLIEYGSTNFSIDFTQVEDRNATGDEFQSASFAVVQNFDHVGTEVYGAVRWHSLDAGGALIDLPGPGVPLNFTPNATLSPDDVWAFIVGARVKF